ncbi:MAG: AAA family ATPase [Alphaproteobacteria bacterium]|nr:AAA family ATPase [Alphaproteobacteria bacterium]
MFKLGAWCIDPLSREVSDGTSTTRLSPKAMGVLTALDQASGQVVSRTELLDQVWAGVTVGEEVLTHAIAELRRAFKDSARAPKIVETVHRAGYRLRVRSEPVVSHEVPTEEPVEPEPLPSATLVARAEVKRVTILMVDMGPAVAEVARDGPEATERIIDALAERTAAVTGRFGGTVTDRLNDLMVVAFGVPTSIENPAPRAAAAALALLAEADIGHTLRAALSSGEVVQRPSGGDHPPNLSGLPLSTAAEILAATPPGRVWLDDTTRLRAAGAVQVELLGPDTAPASIAHQTVYELEEIVQDEARLRQIAERGLSHYVSRRLELALLRESAEEVRAGHGRILAFSGEAGIGKSRLFHEFLTELPSDEWLILKAAAPRGEATPFRGATRMLSEHFSIAADDDADHAKSKLIDRLSEFGDAQDLIAPLSTLLYLPIEDDQFRALAPARRLSRIEDALRRLLALEAARRPVALVIEDLHWIDPRSEGALNAILPAVPSSRILALLNYRPEYSAAFQGLPAFTHRRLDALSADAESEMLDGLIGSSPDLDPIRRAVAERAGGNPLFVEEYVTSLVESGALEGTRGVYRLGKSPVAETPKVPESIQEILAARIDRMEPREKDVLETCAAIGPETRLRLLTALSDLPEEALQSALEKLLAADLLRQDSLEPETRIFFKHAVTHEVAYAGLHSDRRREIHKRIAEALEADGMKTGADNAARLAEHWTKAAAPARAIPYWQETGRAAIFRAANRSAVRYFEAALELIPEVPDSIDRQWRELELSLALGVALVAAEGIGSDRVRAIYARAEALAVWLGAKRDKFIAQWGLHHNSETRDAFPQAVELTHRMAETARESGEPTLLLQADHACWATRLAQGRLDDVLTLTTASDALYRQCPDHGDAAQFAGHDPRACAISHGAIAHWIKGDAETALTEAQLALDHARAVNHPTSIAHAQMFLAKVRFLRDEPEALAELCDQLSGLADEHGFVDYADIATFLRSWAGWRLAGRGAPQNDFTAALDAADRLTKTTAEVLLVPAAAEMRAATGNIDGGLAMIEQALTVSRKKGVALSDAELLRTKARLLLAKGGEHAETAADCLERASDIAEGQNAWAFARQARQDLVSAGFG